MISGLPPGVPKLIVSTAVSADTSVYVRETGPSASFGHP